MARLDRVADAMRRRVIAPANGQTVDRDLGTRDVVLLAETRRLDRRYLAIRHRPRQGTGNRSRNLTLVADHHRAVSEAGAVELYPKGQITVLSRRMKRSTDVSILYVFAHGAMKLTQHSAQRRRRL